MTRQPEAARRVMSFCPSACWVPLYRPSATITRMRVLPGRDRLSAPSRALTAVVKSSCLSAARSSLALDRDRARAGDRVDLPAVGDGGGKAGGLAPAGEGGQRVADRAGRAAVVFGDLADLVRAGAGGEPLGNLAAKLTVAEPALRGRCRNSGGDHREYLRENARAGITDGRALRRNPDTKLPGNFLVISGYATTLSRLFHGSQRLSASK